LYKGRPTRSSQSLGVVPPPAALSPGQVPEAFTGAAPPPLAFFPPEKKVPSRQPNIQRDLLVAPPLRSARQRGPKCSDHSSQDCTRPCEWEPQTKKCMDKKNYCDHVNTLKDSCAPNYTDCDWTGVQNRCVHNDYANKAPCTKTPSHFEKKLKDIQVEGIYIEGEAEPNMKVHVSDEKGTCIGNTVTRPSKGKKILGRAFQSDDEWTEYPSISDAAKVLDLPVAELLPVAGLSAAMSMNFSRKHGYEFKFPSKWKILMKSPVLDSGLTIHVTTKNNTLSFNMEDEMPIQNGALTVTSVRKRSLFDVYQHDNSRRQNLQGKELQCTDRKCYWSRNRCTDTQPTLFDIHPNLRQHFRPEAASDSDSDSGEWSNDDEGP